MTAGRIAIIKSVWQRQREAGNIYRETVSGVEAVEGLRRSIRRNHKERGRLACEGEVCVVRDLTDGSGSSFARSRGDDA